MISELDIESMTAIEGEGDEEGFPYDLSVKENVLVEVLFDLAWRNGAGADEVAFESVTVLSGDVSGSASFEASEGGCLDYMLLQTVKKSDFINGEGWYVFEDVAVTYTRGDGWTTDDDAEVEYKLLRPATQEEIAQC